MTETHDDSFWTNVPQNVQQGFEDTFGKELLEEIPQIHDGQARSLEERLLILESFATRNSSANAELGTKAAATLQVQGVVQELLGDYAAYETTCRQLLYNNSASEPDLAALSNLAYVLVLQQKDIEAEAILRALTPLVRNTVGRNSPQALGCYRNMVKAVHRQGKIGEAHAILDETRRIVADITDVELQRDETDATQVLIAEICA